MTTDRDGNRSNPYRPDPDWCCEACVFGRGEHAKWCPKNALNRYWNATTPKKEKAALKDLVFCSICGAAGEEASMAMNGRGQFSCRRHLH